MLSRSGGLQVGYKYCIKFVCLSDLSQNASIKCCFHLPDVFLQSWNN